MTDKIKVFVRLRPSVTEGPPDMTNSYATVLDYSDHRICPLQGKDADRGSKGYVFQRVFSPTSTNTEVFGEVRDITLAALDGKSGTILAYGQTATGKTHTMRGCDSDPGISERVVSTLFEDISARTGWRHRVEVSYFEIHNERVFDLLAGSNKELKVGCDSVVGLHHEAATTAEDAKAALLVGEENRRKARTDMNEHSSRSHTVFRIMITGQDTAQGKTRTAMLNLVDLAGSENAKAAGYNDGSAAREGGAINKSLLALTNVIHALADRQQHVNYRDSKLTRLLANSLGGAAQTYLICCVTAAKRFFAETMYTIHFANRARVVYNTVKVNETDGSWTVSWDAHAQLHQMHLDDLADAEKREKQAQRETSVQVAACMEHTIQEFEAEAQLHRELDYMMQQRCHDLAQEVDTLRASLARSEKAAAEAQAAARAGVAQELDALRATLVQRDKAAAQAVTDAQEAVRAEMSCEIDTLRTTLLKRDKAAAQAVTEAQEAVRAEMAHEMETIRGKLAQHDKAAAHAAEEAQGAATTAKAATAEVSQARQEARQAKAAEDAAHSKLAEAQQQLRAAQISEAAACKRAAQLERTSRQEAADAPRNEEVLRKIEDITEVLSKVGIVNERVVGEMRQCRDTQLEWPATARHTMKRTGKPRSPGPSTRQLASKSPPVSRRKISTSPARKALSPLSKNTSAVRSATAMQKKIR
eukprot:TRINITY_DN9013_c0_g1_i1.p1 TRINITY_DN9013_c0_g1~~TRINITY_DN9013_c0_g1_i1.p1  ORF type:complete len:725 (+),score=208.94 TRINITY_DN9013_c0_g1_i1:73-2175(+)